MCAEDGPETNSKTGRLLYYYSKNPGSYTAGNEDSDTHKVVASLSSLHQLGGHVLNGATEGVGPVVLKQQHMMTPFVTGLTQQPVS